MDRLKKIIKKAGIWLVIICLAVGIISLFGGNNSSSGNGLKKTVSEARNLVGAEEKSSMPNVKIASGKTANIEVPPLKWTSWIICGGQWTFYSSDKVKVKFSDGKQIIYEPGMKEDVGNRKAFKVYNPSADNSVMIEVTVE
jgi:hypothetical protein